MPTVPPPTLLNVARLAYDAYADSTGGLTFDGRPMPSFGDLPPHVVTAWQAAALAILDASDHDAGVPALPPAVVDAAARAAHEVNRAYCLALGDPSQRPWEEAPEWQQKSARLGVLGVAAGNTPAQSHESWMAQKQADGWVWGPMKDEITREHPCLVPYAELPPAQREKDRLFVGTVRLILDTLAAMTTNEAP